MNKKSSVYFDTPSFLYVCRNLPCSLRSPTLSGLGLFCHLQPVSCPVLPFRECWLEWSIYSCWKLSLKCTKLLCIPSLRGTEDINRQLTMASLSKVVSLLYAFSLRNLHRKNMNSCLSYVTTTWIPIVWEEQSL